VGCEHIPLEGAVVFVGNHPNSLIDPLVAIASSTRHIHFAAKDVLFESRLLRVFLDAMGAVPIRRRMDHPDGGLDNSSAFQALYEVLESEGAVGIFPEGVSHNAAHLLRLKTGAARIALGARVQNPGLKLSIIPIGLNYTHPRQFRSRVLVQFGEPLEVDQIWSERFSANPKDTAIALTETIQNRLEALTINAKDWRTLRLLDGVRRLYQPPRIPLEARIELARRFNRAYAEHKDDPDVQHLLERVARYQERLEDIEFTDDELRREPSFRRLARSFILRCIWFFFWLPLAAPGFVVHAPLGLLAGWGGRRFTPRKDVVGTAKMMAGAIGVLLFYVGILMLSYLYGGVVGGFLALIIFPLSGYATIRVLERAASLRRLVRRATNALFVRKELEELRCVRRVLQENLIAEVHARMPPDLVPLFPKEVRRE
jgi:1-acyl-sn-glycerol-3-phosphate acyltransferase